MKTTNFDQDCLIASSYYEVLTASVGETIPIFNTNTIQSNPEPPTDTRPYPNDVNATHDNAAHQNRDNVPHQNPDIPHQNPDIPHQNPVDHDHINLPNIATIPEQQSNQMT